MRAAALLALLALTSCAAHRRPPQASWTMMGTARALGPPAIDTVATNDDNDYAGIMLSFRPAMSLLDAELEAVDAEPAKPKTHGKADLYVDRLDGDACQAYYVYVAGLERGPVWTHGEYRPDMHLMTIWTAQDGRFAVHACNTASDARTDYVAMTVWWCRLEDPVACMRAWRKEDGLVMGGPLP